MPKCRGEIKSPAEYSRADLLKYIFYRSISAAGYSKIIFFVVLLCPVLMVT